MFCLFLGLMELEWKFFEKNFSLFVCVYYEYFVDLRCIRNQKRMTMEKLTFQEEEVMLIVWRLGEGVIKDFIQEMDEPRPPYTTVASIVKNLERKGFVTARRYGNTYVYTPAVDENDYKNRFLSGVVRNYFADSYKEMVTFFAEKQKISAEELKEIVRLIEKG